MDCLTFSTQRDSLQCTASDAKRLTALLKDDGPRVGEDQDDLDHGFTLAHEAQSGQLFIFAEDGQCNPEALPVAFCQAVGEIAQRAGMEAIEFGVAQISTRFALNSHDGYQFRIQQDGRLVYPILTWPAVSARAVLATHSGAPFSESTGSPAPSNDLEAALAAADPILAALDAVFLQVGSLWATKHRGPDLRQEALELVLDRLASIQEKVARGELTDPADDAWR